MPADLFGEVLARAAARRAAVPQQRREEPVTAPLAPMAGDGRDGPVDPRGSGPLEADGSDEGGAA